jgi:hypothetical protein
MVYIQPTEEIYPEAQGDTWCNTSFAKRIDITVNNTGGSALTGYQVYVNLSSNPLNETSIRVYNITSCTLRPHWCENEISGDCYGVWINYSAVAGSGWTNNTAIYYDNTVVSSASNGTATFEFFDDFEYNESSFTEQWSLESGATQQKSVPFVLYDYDNDSIDEIYTVAADAAKIYVFDWDGTILRQENITLHYGSSSKTCGIDVADIDNDGNEEIIYTECDSVAGHPAYLTCVRFNTSAGLTQLWQKQYDPAHDSPPGQTYADCLAVKIGNLTTTAGLEVVTAAGNSGDARIYCYDKDGNEEWNVDYGTLTECRGIDIGDYDGNGTNEAIIIDGGAGASAGYTIRNGEDGSELCTISSVPGETLDLVDIDGDGAVEMLYGSEGDFRVCEYSGGSCVDKWTKSVSDDAEWVTWSPEKIDVGSGLEWLALSTGRHQYIYIQHQDVTNYKSVNIGANSWTGHFFQVDGFWFIAVGLDTTGYPLKVYDIDLNELASINGAGQLRHIESYGNKLFVTSRGNPNQYAIYEFTNDSGRSLSDKWNTSGSPSISGGKLNLTEDDDVLGKTSFSTGHAIISNAIADEQDTTFCSLVDPVLYTSYIKIQANDGATRCGDSNFDCLCWFSKKDPSYDGACVDSLLDFRYAYYNYEITWETDKVRYLQDNTEFHNYTGSNISIVNLNPYLQVWDSSAPSTLTVDWIIVRKYASTEPSSSLGDEEGQPQLKWYLTGLDYNSTRTLSQINASIASTNLSHIVYINETGTQWTYTYGSTNNGSIEVKQGQAFWVRVTGTIEKERVW